MKLEVNVPVLMRVRIIALIAVGFVLSVLVPQQAQAEVAGCVAARKQVTVVAGKVQKIMSSKSGRQSRMASVFRSHANTRSMANFALGRYVRLIPARDKREYYRLANKMLVHLFTTKMGAYNGRSYRIWNCKPKGRGYAIGGAIVESNGNIVIDVHWLMMPSGGRLKVEDISVAHIWLRQEQRTAFRRVLSKSRGNFKALLAHMRKQVSGKR